MDGNWSYSDPPVGLSHSSMDVPSSNCDPFVENWLRDSYHDSGFHSANTSHEASVLLDNSGESTPNPAPELNIKDGQAVISRFIQSCSGLGTAPYRRVLSLLETVREALANEDLPVECWDQLAVTIATDYIPSHLECRSPLTDAVFESGVFSCLMSKLLSLIVRHWGRDTSPLTDFSLTLHMLDAVSRITRFASITQLGVGMQCVHMLCSLLTLLLPAQSAAFNNPNPPSVTISLITYSSVLSRALKVVCHLARSPTNFQHFREQRGLETLHCWQEELWFKLTRNSNSQQLWAHHPLFAENHRVLVEQLRWSVCALVDLSATPNNKLYLIQIHADIIWAEMAECQHEFIDQRLRDKCDKGRTALAKDRAHRQTQ